MNVSKYERDDVESTSSDTKSESSTSVSEVDQDAEEDGELEGPGERDAVEHQIEGDFDYLIGTIQATDDDPASATLSKIWDAPSSADTEEQFQADLRAASGIGRARKGKGKGQGRRTGPVLSHQVRALIGEGNAAYVNAKLQEAMRIMTEVIRIEPRAASAWTVLASCYRELNEPTKALQTEIMRAHLSHDPDEWHRLARQSRDEGHSEQALYCLRKAIRLDPTNYGAIWDRASLAKEVGDFHGASNAYLMLMKHFPYDTAILTELRHVLIELGDLKLCARLYQEAFEHFTSLFPEGKFDNSASNDSIDPALTGNMDVVSITPPLSPSEFTFMDVLVLADLYNSLGWYDRAIKTIRAGCRWLQGRSRQKYWDTCPDDREYDVEEFLRDDNEDTLAIKQGFHPLDINARHRLALARLKMGDVAEGRMHASIILSEDIVDFAPLFAEIADTFFEHSMYSEARPIYDMLGSDTTTSSVHVLMQAAECRRNLGETNDASEIYEHIIDMDPTNDDAKMKLAEIYEATAHPRKALELVYQVIDSRKNRAGGTSDGTPHEGDEETGPMPLFAEKRRGKGQQGSSTKAHAAMSRQRLLELERKKEEETAEWYRRLQELQDSMRKGDREAETEWLTNAEKLIEMFRETRSLFVTRSARPYRGTIRTRRRMDDEQEMATRLELELEHDKEERESRKTDRHQDDEAVHFRGIHFDDWLSVVMEYAFLLTRREQFDVAEDVIRHFMLSTVYSKQKYQDTLRLTLATCAVRVRKFDVSLEMFRRLMLNYQFNNELVRLFLASLASGLSQTDQTINTSFQKFVLREMRTHAKALDGKAHWISANRRFMSAVSGGKQDPDEEEDDSSGEVAEPSRESENGDSARPTRSNPVLPTLYGQSLILAKSYQGALFYLLHAYDYFPNDPLICMTLAVASLGRAMQRQSDNRNFLITQALGFISKYRSFRGAGGNDLHADEIEYNFGRAFHQIGLLSHAVKHYERVLKIIEKRQASGEQDIGVSREAAHNLCLIYTTTGATPLAKAVAQRWLSI